MIDRDELVVFENTPANILAGVYGDYTAMTGKPLRPGQSETLLLNTFAYREWVIREQCNEAIRNTLVPFATAPMLDYLGAFVGVERLPASGALTVISFDTKGNNPTPTVVPAGTRVATTDGQFVFETVADLTIPQAFPGPVLLSVEAQCTTVGVEGNNQLPTVILDPVSYVVSATPTASSGGSQGETDAQLRARIQLAPNSFSVAGPEDAYKFFAKAAHPDVIDVAVTNPFPGVVELFPLVAGGVPAQVILDAVEAACSARNVRPLCDTVEVSAPTVVYYYLSVELTLYKKAVVATEKASAEKALTTFAAERAAGLGRDVVREQALAKCMTPGVYDAKLLAPASTLVIAENEVAICKGITVNVVGFNNG